MPVLRSYDGSRQEAERQLLAILDVAGAQPLSTSCARIRLPRPILVGVDLGTARAVQSLGAERGLRIDLGSTRANTRWMVRCQPEALFFGTIFLIAWLLGMLAGAATGSFAAILIGFGLPFAALIVLSRRGHDLLAPMAIRRSCPTLSPLDRLAALPLRGPQRRAASKLRRLVAMIDGAVGSLPAERREGLAEACRRAYALADAGLEGLCAMQGWSDALGSSVGGALPEAQRRRLRDRRAEALERVRIVISAIEIAAADLAFASAPIPEVELAANATTEASARAALQAHETGALQRVPRVQHRGVVVALGLVTAAVVFVAMMSVPILRSLQ